MHQEKGAGVLAQEEAVSAEKKDAEVSISVKSMIVMSGLVFILIGIVMAAGTLGRLLSLLS